MKGVFTSRFAPTLALAAALLPWSAGFCDGRGQAARPMPQAPRSPGPSARAGSPVPGRNNGTKNNQEHLPQWMARHQSQSPEQQQRALENEPGFRQLPQQTQQRMRERLSQLNSLPARQRTHMLERAEQMENLNPQQRQQVRGAMAQLGGLPADRRRVVARAFRDLRGMNPEQRQGYLNSEAMQQQFSPEERGTLNNLMTVEPLLPAQPRGGYQPRPLSPPPQ